MTARTRNRDLRTANVGTYYTRVGPTTTTRSVLRGTTEACEDHIGNWTVVNPLSLRTNITSYPTLSGVQLTGGGLVDKEFTHFPIGYHPGPTDPRIGFPAHSAPELSALAWKILSETNPSAPHVSIPSFIGELKDFLSLIKGNGESVLDLIKGGKRSKLFLKGLSGWTYGALKESVTPRRLVSQVAQGYVSWRWALKPLYHDLQALLHFTKAVNNRLAWLHHLRQGKVLKRRVHLGTSEIVQSPVNATLHSEGAIISGKRQLTYTRKMWGTAQWKLVPGSEIPELGGSRLDKLANALAAGFTDHEALATAWQLCPWSWLIDWFTNIQDTIQATNNTIGCTWANIAFMRTTISHATFTVVSKPAWVTVSSDYYFERSIRKERIPIVPLLPFSLTYLPILEYRKWSILAALAASSRLISPGR